MSDIPLKRKSGKVAFLLWLFLGGFGAHMFYLGRYSDAVAVIVAIWIGWAIHPIIPFVAIIVSGIVLVDRVAGHNERVEEEERRSGARDS